MSGGSYNYAYSHLDRLADDIEVRLEKHGEELSAEAAAERRWFVELLRAAAKAAHNIEWVDSCDYPPDREIKTIRRVRQLLSAASPSDDEPWEMT
jgi:hypothetical protein